MAVHIPVPPTPPTPPEPPRIVLGEGGSVRDSTAPQSFTGKSDAEINEDAARSAVAHGAGKLTKTTVERPEKNTKDKTSTEDSTEKTSTNQKSVSTPQSQSANATESAAPVSSRTAVIAPARTQQGQMVADPEVRETQRQMAKEAREAFNKEMTSTAGAIPAQEGHGPVYWTFSIVSLLVLVVVALYVLLNRHAPPHSAAVPTAKTADITPNDAPKINRPNASAVSSVPAKDAPARPVRNPKEAPRFEVRI